MNNIKVKRIMAYLIDILVVSFLTLLVSNINFLNPYKDEYDKAYTKYVEYYEEYIESDDNVTTNEIYTEEYGNIMHDLQLYGSSYTIIEICVIILYFTLFPLFNKDQTIGKRLLKIKVVPQKKERKFITYLLRSIIVPIWANIILYCSLANIFNLIVVFIFDGITYLNLNLCITLAFCVYCYIDVIMMLSNPEGKSLHDRILKTKVEEVC